MSVFPGETASVQVALRPPMKHDFRLAGALEVVVDGPATARTSISQVELVPCSLAAFPQHDGGYDRDTPGLYPDLLRPAPDGLIRPLLGQWTAAWIDLLVPSAGNAGEHELGIAVRDADGNTIFSTHLCVTVVPADAPELAIVNAHWFHCDGLASHYGVGVFSEEHWSIIDAFMGSAARMGANSLLTPTWTPPLDTAVGGTRLPTQLIGISEGPGYHFDFSKLLRWVGLCAKHGIRYLEIAHLFTQWGAKATPAIYVETAKGLERRFGWDVPATSASYRELMAALLPALRSFFAEHWSLDRVIFHISDEPEGPEALAGYQQAKGVVADLLDGLTVVDALSDFEFYSSGVVPTPVVASDAVAPFLAAGVKDLWIYYCVAQDTGVANRFISMPSVRNRVLGHQLFALGCAGFLHWGFNFYNTAHSLAPVDPFKDTCAGGAFPGGDAFMVYPGPDGVPGSRSVTRCSPRPCGTTGHSRSWRSWAVARRCWRSSIRMARAGALPWTVSATTPFITEGFASWSIRKSRSAWVKQHHDARASTYRVRSTYGPQSRHRRIRFAVAVAPCAPTGPRFGSHGRM